MGSSLFFMPPCSSRRLAASLLLVLVAALAPAPTAVAQDALTDRLDAILEGSIGEAAIWGLYVHDIERDRPVYTHNAEKALTPASNLKVYTTAAALDILGPDYRYETTLYFDGTVEGTVLRGDLIIRGAGDPTLGSQTVRGPDPLRAWAKRLADMGVTRIDGRVIGDARALAYQPYAEGWDVAHVAREAFAPPSGGLVYGDNLVRIHLRATRPGQPAAVRDEPAGYFTIRNHTTTSTRRARRYTTVDRRLGQEVVDLRGSVTRNYRGSFRMPVADPTAFTLYNFHVALERAGVQVDGPLVNAASLSAPPTYDGQDPLFAHYSPPMAEIVRYINKESNNLFAEQVFRTLGWDGSIEGAARRVRMFLRNAGIDSQGLHLLDGSGLSRKSLVTPASLGQLLAHMYTHEAADAFRASLAGGGERQTTLQYRLAGSNVEAKTGSLRGVRTLSGYTTAADGRPLAFVVFANNFAIPSYRIRNLTDSLVLALSTAALADAR
ncbi:MAG: D-alanyl-D-alanine carboxypeptidase/D-alanyl-D-alanine-endopeptidase [Bacteroidetes bacterium]|nr:D-alanyl-D-alanine carboxypeptidase/D-alanyl-D-alanine-endopeptidase [Bacteroidota bacterium]